MTFFKLAYRNLKSNLSRYSIYFFSIIFAITIYFLFVSVQFDETLSSISEGLYVGHGFLFGSQVILIFSALFVWYSNAFFIKSRKNEIGIFELLGVKKRQITAILLIENLILGIFALSIGIIVGTFLNKLFLMFVAYLLNIKIAIHFSVNIPAILYTLKFFLILFIINGISNLFIVYRYKLIELFQASKKREKMPSKKIIGAILGLILIIGGYIFALNTSMGSFVTDMLITLVVVVVGTELFFIYFLPYILLKLKENKNYYFKSIHLISTSNLLYRVKSFGRTLALIAILSASTLTAVGVTYSMIYTEQISKEQNYFYDISFSEQHIKDAKIKVDEYLSKTNYSINNELISKIKFGTINYQNSINYACFIKESDYYKAFEVKNIPYTKLANKFDSVFINIQGYSIGSYYNDKSFEYNNQSFNIIDYSSSALYNQNFSMAEYALVIKDELFNEIKSDSFNLYAYTLNKPLSKEDSTKLNDFLPFESDFTANTEYGFYQTINSKIYALMSAFVGLVFLVSTASILYFKLLIEATEYKSQFEILNKIGLNEKERQKIIRKQLQLVFFSPLIMGTLHSIVAINSFSNMIVINLWKPILFNVISYSLIYMIFYFLTKKEYNKILNSKY